MCYNKYPLSHVPTHTHMKLSILTRTTDSSSPLMNPKMIRVLERSRESWRLLPVGDQKRVVRKFVFGGLYALMILCGHLFTPCILPSFPVIAVRATSVAHPSPLSPPTLGFPTAIRHLAVARVGRVIDVVQLLLSLIAAVYFVVVIFFLSSFLTKMFFSNTPPPESPGNERRRFDRDGYTMFKHIKVTDNVGIPGKGQRLGGEAKVSESTLLREG
eukprot:GHVQ01029928.1.p1 GENE.GHVQ01029928.1~~GHVQ01029928.1.p1  ORF type:complete len:215 (+),score=28.45 GHVQ01029928.1:64-708(+)